MLQCLSLKTSSATSSLPTSPPTLNHHFHPPLSQGNSTDNTPRSSTQPSPTVNLTREYTLNVQSNSYNEMWSKIHVFHPNQDPEQVQVEHVNGDEDTHGQLLTEVLQPNRECVEEALRHARPNTLIRLISTYFHHSENTTQVCLSLHQNVHRARVLYAPIHELLDVLPNHSHSLTQSQCDRAFDIFIQFDRLDNPFPSPDSHNFQEMRHCFSQLKQQLDHHLRKSRSWVHLVYGTAVGVVKSAVACIPHNFAKKELAHVAQLEAATKGTYVLNNDLDTIDRLVARLHAAIEDNKFLIRIGLERGRDKHPILEVVKLLHKNHLSFIHQLEDLEEHICLCFNTVNRARSLLLQEIHLHQTYNS